MPPTHAPPIGPSHCATIGGTGTLTGPVCVLLHGFLGDRRDVEPLRAALASHGNCVCISVDLPGHGDSARLQSVTAAIEAVELAIDNLVGKSCALMLAGYSMGGRLALQLASRNPSRVKAVAVLSSNPGIEGEDKQRERAVRDARLADRLRAMAPPAFAAWLRDEWYRAPLWGNLGQHPAFETMMRRRTDGTCPAELAESLVRESVGLQAPLWQWLHAAPMPILFVAGRADPAYAPMVARVGDMACAPACGLAPLEAVTAGRRLSAALIDGAAHALLLQAPDQVARLTGAFLMAAIKESAQGAPRAIPRGVSGGGGGDVRVSALRAVPFELPLTTPLPLARGAPLTCRAGCLLLLSGSADDVSGGGARHGVGEMCPLPHFHAESYQEAHAQLTTACAALHGVVVPWSVAMLDGSMTNWLASLVEVALLPSVRCAIETAVLHMLSRFTEGGLCALLARSGGGRFGGRARHTHVRINGLMARGETACVEEAADDVHAPPSAEMPAKMPRSEKSEGRARLKTMRTWKLKVGGSEPAAEGARVARLLAGCESLGVRLRLDANQAWSVEAAGAFCTALRHAYAAAGTRAAGAPDGTSLSRADGSTAMWPPRCLEFCEEPLSRECGLMEMDGLHAAHGLKYALDESVVPVAAELMDAWAKGAPTQGPRLAELRSRLAGAGCGALVLKPTLLGGLEVSAALADAAAELDVPVVLTSAFESGAIHAHVTLLAAVLAAPSVAHGLSTYERLAADVLTPPFASLVRGGDLIDAAGAQSALDASADAMATTG